MSAKKPGNTRPLWCSRTGATATEYAALLALVILVLLVTTMLLGQNTSGTVSTASGMFDESGDSPADMHGGVAGGRGHAPSQRRRGEPDPGDGGG
jgi:Flp pilus assembly pilin Flp